MSEPKVQQSGRFSARWIVWILAVVIALIATIVFLLNTKSVQKWAFEKLVAPTLADYQVELRWDGLEYTFPATLTTGPTELYFQDTLLLRAGTLKLENIAWQSGLIVDQILLDSLSAYPALDDGIWQRFATAFSDSTDTTTSDVLSPVAIKVHQLGIAGLHWSLDTLVGRSLLELLDVRLGRDLEVLSLITQHEVLAHQWTLTADSLRYGGDGSASTQLALNYSGGLQSDFRLHYHPDSVFATADIQIAEKFTSPVPLTEDISAWLWAVEGGALHVQAEQFGDLVLANVTYNHPLVRSEGHGEWYLDEEKQKIYLDVSVVDRLFEQKGLEELAPLLEYFSPHRLEAEVALDHLGLENFSASLTDGPQYVKASANRLDGPIRAEVHLPKLKTGPVNGISARAALVPSLQVAMDGGDFDLRGVITEVGLNEYHVEGLTFGYLHGSSDSVWVSVLDDEMDLEVTVHERGDRYYFDGNIAAFAMGLVDTADQGNVLSTAFTGHIDTSLVGHATFSSIRIRGPEIDFTKRNLVIDHEQTAARHELRVSSPAVEAELTGTWDWEDLAPIGMNVFEQLQAKPTGQQWVDANLRWSLKVQDLDWLAELTHQDLHLDAGTEVHGFYNGPKARWSLDANIPEISSSDWSVKKLQLNGVQSKTYQDVKLNINELAFGETFIDTVYLWANGHDTSRLGNLYTVVRDSIPYRVKAQGKYSHTHIDWSIFDYNIGTSDFELPYPSRWSFNRRGFSVKNFDWVGDDGRISLYAKWDYEQGDRNQLLLSVRQLQPVVLNYLLRDPEMVLGGEFNILAKAMGEVSTPYIQTEAQVSNLSLNQKLLGNLVFDADYAIGDTLVYNTSLVNRSVTTLKGEGYYNEEQDSTYNLFNVHNFGLAPFNDFLGGIFEGLFGGVRGQVIVEGPLEKWRMDGDLEVDRLAMTVPVIGARFGAESGMKIRLTDQVIRIDSTRLYNVKDSTMAWLWGGISHNRFDQMAFDIRLEADSIRGVDMKRDIEGYYYGVAIAAGQMVLEGPIDQLHLDLAVQTKEGTDFKIPLDNPTLVEPLPFLKFVEPQRREPDTEVMEDQEVKTREYFTTDISIAATEDARIELVLDEVLGDVISAYGNGNLRLRLLEDESMELYGLYTLQRGNYLFTLQNIINKPFEIRPGGTILWSGDLYEAEVDLEASYRLRTDLTGLVTNPNYNGDKVPVDLIIGLSGSLMSPDIAFSIELPESPTSYQEELNRHFFTPDQINYQAFSLLLLGDFYRQDLGVQQGLNLSGSVSKSTSEVLVSQFGNWLAAGLGDYVDVELDYTTGANPYDNLGTATGDQLNLAVSKNFMDGRLRINSSFDVPVGQGNTSTLLLGDTEVEYKVTKDGRVLLKAFNRSNRNDPLMQSTGPYTQGVGIQYRKEFEGTGWLRRKGEEE